MKILEFLTSIMGVVMSLGYYPQAYTIFKNKSAKNVSILTFLIFAAGTFIWTLYGILSGNKMIIFGFVFGWIGSWLVLGLSLYFRSRDKNAIVEE